MAPPGVDPIYGHGALDLENAVAPQGNLSLQTSGILNQRSFSVDQSHISTSGGMSSALSAVFSKHDIIVTDSYDRGYTTGLDAFVGSGLDAVRDHQTLDSFTMGQSAAVRASLGDTTFAYAVSSLDALGDDITHTGFANPYAALVEGAGSMALETRIDGATLRIAHAFSEQSTISDGSYFAAEARADLGTHGLAVGLGRLTEAGAFIGTDVTGAFGENLSAATQFISLKGDIALDDRQAITLGGAFGNTDFSGDGLLQSGNDIRTSSVGIGYAHNGVFRQDDRFTISASSNMKVTGGKMTIVTPTGLGAAQNGIRSSTVEMATANVDMEKTSAPMDIKFGYETALMGGRLAFGAAIRDGDTSHRVGSIGYSLRF